jgi:hypothetical protein
MTNSGSLYKLYFKETYMESLKEDCPCPKLKCERHGNCEACEAYHGRKSTLTFCKREKKTKKNHLNKLYR